MARAALVLCLFGCAGVQPGVADSSDTPCGRAGANEVRLRNGVGAWPPLLSCREAVALVEKEGAPLERGWTFLFTTGVIGFGVDRDNHFFAMPGATFTGHRTIEVHVHHMGETLRHEVRHAHHFELGEPDNEDFGP